MEGSKEDLFVSFNDDSSNVKIAKVISMCVLSSSSFLVGIVPIIFRKKLNKQTVDGEKPLIISLLLCFGGGVLLFTSFLHLQPEVRESFAHLQLHHKIPPFLNERPMAEISFCIGFFLVYLIEVLVDLFATKKLEKISDQNIFSKQQVNAIGIPISKSEDGGISIISNFNKGSLISEISSEDNVEHKHSIISLGGFLTVLALSFHAVFEGLAVGLEGNERNVWYLFVAIALHKLVISFCVGLELVTSFTKKYLAALYILLFSIVTPLGIGIGILLMKSRNQEDFTIALLHGMAAGTLIYVVFFEILAREKGNKHGASWKFVAILCGFFVMLFIQEFAGHNHSHGDHDHDHNSEDHQH